MVETQNVAPPPTDPGPSEVRRRRPGNPVRRVTLAVVVIGAIYLAYSVVADRLIPYSAQATVQSYHVRVAPEVSGKVIAIGVVDGLPVKAGALLFAVREV